MCGIFSGHHSTFPFKIVNTGPRESAAVAFFDANLPTLPLTISGTFLVVVDEFIEQCFQ